jgi:starch synthase
MSQQRGAKRVLIVAAENDALPGGKVGGIGDVVRDVPPALARRGWEVAVVTPSYGFLHKGAGARVHGEISFEFAGAPTTADLFRIPGKRPTPGVSHYIVDHPAFAPAEGDPPHIYTDDPPDDPFASDATRYALFCAAVAQAVVEKLFESVGCIHLHDWHAAFLLILRRYHEKYLPLKEIRTIYTIHNMALQGVRPFKGGPSSMASWYPEIPPADDLADPRWPDCLNPMAVGIRFADAVHTVSPSYAAEILKAGDPPRSWGGEGLEADLQAVQKSGRLFGILNGCDYPEERVALKPTFSELLDRLRSEVLVWVASQGVFPAHLIALERLRDLRASFRPPGVLLTSVTRAVDQKIFLLRAAGTGGLSGIEGILKIIADRGIYILLGTGDRAYENFLVGTSARHPNFIFLNGYSDLCARMLYAGGDLFVMPSSFEPCGISQMLAMRDGQPCLVHAVGGLKDTVKEGINGFSFEGEAVERQVDGLIEGCRRAIGLKWINATRWRAIREQAAASRFPWDRTVEEYEKKLYASPGG